MRRLFSGAFDPSGRFPGVAPARRLGLRQEPAKLADCGSLRVGFTGPPPRAGAPLVLLDGFLANRCELASALQGTPQESSEELLARAYRRWGPGMVERLRGDFALVIWDQSSEEGLLARDRLGMRCIYVYEGSSPMLRFAGEISHLIAAMPTRPPPDPVSVAHWAAISRRPGTHTLYDGVRRLEPGSVLLLDRSGWRPRRYWNATYAEPVRRGRPELAAELRAGLSEAISARLPTEGSASVLMSGGLDSASVAALAANVSPDAMLAHSGEFPGLPQIDESGLIEQLRARFALGGARARVRPGGLLASVLDHQQAWEVPLLGWGDFWTLPLLRRAVREGVCVTLGGDGGDELFGARAYLIADRLRAAHPIQAARLAGRLPGAGEHPPPRARARVLASFGLSGALGTSLDASLERLAPRRGAPRWLTATAARDLVRSDDPHAWKRLDGPRWWAHPAHGLTHGLEESGILEHQRQRAAFAGLEARLPMLDPDLITLALSQPPWESFDAHLSRPLLREAMDGLLPDEVRLRPQKAWFDSLILACLTGPDQPVIRRLLTAPGAEIGAYIPAAELARALEVLPAASGVERFRAMHLIWRALTIECWLRLQRDPGGATLPDPAGLTTPKVEIHALGTPGHASARSPL